MASVTLSIPIINEERIKGESALPFPPEFLQQIEASNAHNKHAPLALFLIAEHDHNGIHSGLNQQYFIGEVAKTHRVAIEIINDGSQLGGKLRQAVKDNGKAISLLFIAAHGNSDAMTFGKREESLAEFTENDLRNIGFVPFAPHATIILHSCRTGQGLAQKMADVFNCTVLAPKENLMGRKAFFFMSGKTPQFVEKEGSICAFRRGRPSEPVPLASINFGKIFLEKVDHFRELASKGDANAKCELAELLMSMGESIFGRSVDQEIIGCALPAAKMGHAGAQFIVGTFCQHGRGGLKLSEREALKWYEKSAVGGDVDAMYNAGLFYQQGWGCVANNETALEYFEKAAHLGDLDAAYRAGIFYQNRWGCKQSYEKALEYYEMAARHGKADAQLCAASLYKKGLGCAQSFEKALWLYEQAGNQGNIEAQFDAGYLRDMGRGCTQSFEAAANWYRKAAEKGHVIAQYNLGLLLLELVKSGTGGDPELEEAFVWIQEAAKRGHPDAEYKLALFLENGWMCEQSFPLALSWYQKAADQGRADAKAAMERLLDSGVL